MDTTQVRIKNGVLWIDNEAYPLRNIARVGSRWLDPAPIKAAAVKTFILRALGTLFVAFLVGQASPGAAALVTVVVLAFAVWRLSVAMRLQPLYGLVLNTNGVQQDAVWSLDQDEIFKLVQIITEAIGHPDTAQTIFNLHNAVSGDLINQFGSDNVGKQVNNAGAR